MEGIAAKRKSARSSPISTISAVMVLMKPKKSTQKPRIHSYSQHGSKQHSSAYLLSLPEESFAHVTAYLDPLSLYRLSLTCRRLRDHVEQDTVWHRAFLWTYLSIEPEGREAHHDKAELLLRRRENTWKKEYIARWMLIRRLQHSRNATVAHIPTHSAIASHLYFPSTQALLSASSAYGVVARSLPLTGRVLKGYLDSHGTFNGLGIGNPNAEFSIEVSAICLGKEGDAQEGATGRILWGFRNGDVAITRGVKPAEVGRAARLIRSAPADAHRQRVEALVMGQRGIVASAGADGRVKLWDGASSGHTLRCLWASDPAATGNVIGPLCKVQYEGSFVIAASTGGQVLIWHGIDLPTLLTAKNTIMGNMPHIIPPPVVTSSTGAAQDAAHIDSQTTTLLLNVISSEAAFILVHYGDADHFWRFRVNVPVAEYGQPPAKINIECTQFAGGPVGSITAIAASFKPASSSTTPAAPSPVVPSPAPEPVDTDTMFEMSDIPVRVQPQILQMDIDAFATVRSTKEHSFIVSGDVLGRVCLWDWEADGTPAPRQDPSIPKQAPLDVTIVSTWRKWQAHDDGGVSALKLHAGLLITGSSQGSVKVWDPLPPIDSPLPLRVLPSPSPRPHNGQPWEGVSQISLEGDVIVASVGSRIIAWRGGNIGRDKSGQGKAKGRISSRAVSGKFAQQIEMERDIRDSRRELEEEHDVFRSKIVREREQLQKLTELGLDEIGALEYALMLSRDEEEKKTMTGLNSSEDDLAWQEIGSTSRGRPADEADSPDFSPPVSRGSSSSREAFNIGRAGVSVSPAARHVSSSAHSSSSFLASPRLAASLTNAKVQVSPLLYPEPMQAGKSYNPDLSVSPPSFSLDSFSRDSVPTTPINFPSLPPSSRASAHSSPRLSPVEGTMTWRGTGSLGHDRAHTKGWNVVARSPAPPLNESVPVLQAATAQINPSPIKPMEVLNSGRTSLLSAQLASLTPRDRPLHLEEEDEVLRHVMELSLAEAQSLAMEV
ncbi:hypothetical protein DACRYDRAFT_100917 [Dacryopinax primogenitus]|uniref:F-box domain-containing protein n=1 Tax=Dacryopinax primogenitus (strain DJM 731) TaxID=1858805 RepID=M5G390_DACPD|nr:uncharacterized protein DACRYDRAFT_100917 [Dacryopinax primogenitus]EJU00347.1 hypothetical protein DACRYDRAFT_100917 [Dacryopinax primogenitus]